MAGLELPVKLRRGLGQGNVVPADELGKRLKAFDADGDGAVTRDELAQFLAKNHVGGPWFCEVVAKTLWKYVEQRMNATHTKLACDRLGRIIHVAMSRGPRPDRRYEITPEGMAGYEPLRTIRRKDEKAPTEAAPRAATAGQAKPGAGEKPQAPARNASTTPGRMGAAALGPQTRAPAAGRSRPIPRRPGPRR